jgi:flagellar hook-basal body complex protein FliE
MIYLNPTQVTGHELRLLQTDPRHLAGRLDAPGEPAGRESFAGMLADALGEVNSLQQDHDRLSLQAVLDPESVNSHDVTIAAAKANMSLSMTKSIVDSVLQAYREIINVR